MNILMNFLSSDSPILCIKATVVEGRCVESILFLFQAVIFVQVIYTVLFDKRIKVFADDPKAAEL